MRAASAWSADLLQQHTALPPSSNTTPPYRRQPQARASKIPAEVARDEVDEKIGCKRV
jgi:hypothetical protein